MPSGSNFSSQAYILTDMLFPRFIRSETPRYTTKLLFIAAMFCLLVWLTFFDSHSLFQRVKWHRELAQLRASNEEMELRIVEIEAKLEEADTDAVIEQMAREQYGMRKPGEAVYRVQQVE
jgi:cell division protein FtsB